MPNKKRVSEEPKPVDVEAIAALVKAEILRDMNSQPPPGTIPMKDNIKVRIGRNVRRVRENYPMNQTDLGKKANKSQGYINKIENAKIGTSIKMLAKLADALNCDISDFFQKEPLALPPSRSAR